jgi:putative tricarboxylic transport membrane protein
MLENMMGGFWHVLTFANIFLIFIGTAIGIIFGAIPGLTATMAVALCLPVTFGMDIIPSMCLIIGLYLGGISGGLISAILLNIPGTPASLATTFDGHPMAQNGMGGKALATGIISSFLGGIFSILVLFFISPPLAKIAIRFTPYDYFSVIFFSLTMMAGMGEKSLIKGLISGMLGLCFSFVGGAPIDGLPRFTMGVNELSAGFNMLPALIGLFAVPEILNNAAKINQEKKMGRVDGKIGTMQLSIREMVGQKWNFLRSSIVGTAIGILPGVGGGVSNIVAYTIAKNNSKNGAKYGTGIIDGIVASEVSNNAAIGGAMVPLLSLGIPGDAVTALLIGALMIQGISPGPMMFKTQGDIVGAVFTALMFANFMMLILMLSGIKVFVKLLKIPKNILLPIIFSICIVGAFGANNRIFDIWTVLIFGLIGFLMQKFEYPQAPALLGFILGPILEENLRRGLMFSSGSILPFLTKPISVTFLVISVATIILILRKEYKYKKRQVASDQ